ncbi:hypothetical protein BN9982_690009 [Mycobacterium tuberculosis]|nr:hypothetical protein BN9982_690009 [Mycobacterium tuberculosis]
MTRRFAPSVTGVLGWYAQRHSCDRTTRLAPHIKPLCDEAHIDSLDTSELANSERRAEQLSNVSDVTLVIIEAVQRSA